jgi:DNA-binding CsgD family transcriptional regulator
VRKNKEKAHILSDGIISSLYTAATDPSFWNQTLAAIAHATRSVGVDVLIKGIHDREPRAIFNSGLDLTAEKRYRDYYHQIDTPLRHSLAGTPGVCRGCHSEISEKEVGKDEYYQDFYIPGGLRYCAGGYQLANDQLFVLGAHRAVTQDCFEDQALAVLQRVMDHLPHVFRLYDLFQRQKDRVAWLCNALDKMPHPIMVTDVHGRIRYMSPSCDKLEKAAPSLLTRGDKIGCTVPSFHSHLLRLIRTACMEPADLPPAFLTISDPLGRPSLEITVTPLRPEQTVIPREGDALAMVIFRTPFTAPASRSLSKRPYGLSPTELRLAESLIEGTSLEAYAATRRIRISTVRTQIRSILAKTGTRNMVEMVSLLSGLQIPCAEQERQNEVRESVPSAEGRKSGDAALRAGQQGRVLAFG